MDLLKYCYNSSKIIDFIILFYDKENPKNYQNIGNYEYLIDTLSSEEFQNKLFSNYVEEKLSDGLHKLILYSYYQMGKYEKFKK